VISRFTGSGDKVLGTLAEKTATVLQWSTSSHPVQLSVANGFLLLASPARAGRIKLPPGKYPGLRIATRHGWSVELRVAL
jgi:hypothetical protein